MPEAKNPTAARIRSVYEDMVREGVPFSIKDLKVGGNDLDSLPEAKRGSVLKEILVECAVNPQMNDRKKQLDYIRRVKDGIRN
jgi:pilus assembly protein TadC